MQKQKLNSDYVLALQATYEGIELAIAKNNLILQTATVNKFDASKMIITVLNQLLINHTVSLSDIDCIAVNQGPGPFTTLRTVLSCVNGLAFASGIPLVGVNGLIGLAQEQQGTGHSLVVALLNAFNKDVYYAIYAQGTIKDTGCSNIILLLNQLCEQLSDHTVTFVGNGAKLYQPEIDAVFANRAYIPTPLPETVSIGYIAQQGLVQWLKQENISDQLMPIYLKHYSAAVAAPTKS